MDLDDYTDAFFSDPPPLHPVSEGNYTTMNALSDVVTSPVLSDAVAELHVQLGEQYAQGRAVIDNGISDLREQHEHELSNLLATAGKDVAVVHSETMEFVVLRQKREIDDALADREQLRAALERELRQEFIRFITVSASGLEGTVAEFPKCETNLIGFGVTVPCSTVKIPNPLRGVLVGARPKDPALSAIVLDVSPLSYLSKVLALGSCASRHKEHLRRLAAHKHSVLLVTDAGFGLPADLPELLLLPTIPANTLDGLDVGCCSNVWGANVVLRPSISLSEASSVARRALTVDDFRKVIGFAISLSADMLSFAIGEEHLEYELLSLIEAMAATQIDIGAGRLTNAWTVSLAAIGSGQSDTIQNQPVYSSHRQAFNLPITIRVFVPVTSEHDESSSPMGGAKKLFHRVLEGRGLEWTGE